MPDIELESRSKPGSKNRGESQNLVGWVRGVVTGPTSSFTGLWKIITILSA